MRKTSTVGGNVTDKKLMQQCLDTLESLQGGCTDSDDGTVEAITVWCPELIDALRARLAQEDAQPVAWMRERWEPDCGPYTEIYTEAEMTWRDRK